MPVSARLFCRFATIFFLIFAGASYAQEPTFGNIQQPTVDDGMTTFPNVQPNADIEQRILNSIQLPSTNPSVSNVTPDVTDFSPSKRPQASTSEGFTFRITDPNANWNFRSVFEAEIIENNEETLRELFETQNVQMNSEQILVDGQPAVGNIAPRNKKELEAFLQNGSMGKIDYQELFLSLEPTTRNRLLYEDFLPDPEQLPGDTFIQQVAPGVGVDGDGGFVVCTGPSCGTDRVVTPGETCNSSDCPTGQGGALTCDDEFCNVRSVTRLDVDLDGNSDVTYVKSGYPEVVFLRKKIFGEKFGSSCTATIISPGFAITALHCFKKSSSTTILDHFSFNETGVPDGWSKMVTKDPSKTGFHLVSDHSDEIAIVDEIFVSYRRTEATLEALDPLPTRDFALITFAEGLNFPTEVMPILSFSAQTKDYPITFVGFGWTDVREKFGDDWVALTSAQKWRELKQAAFNFIDDIRLTPPQSSKQIVWNHGVPPGTGGPCHFDSGGPIYQGFNRGYWGSPRIVVGVVSALHTSLPAGIETNNIDACLSKRSFLTGELLASFQSGICEITRSAPRGC